MINFQSGKDVAYKKYIIQKTTLKTEIRHAPEIIKGHKAEILVGRMDTQDVVINNRHKQMAQKKPLKSGAFL